MKKLLLLTVLTLSLTIAFSQAKPCCKNKAKTGISCKFNQNSANAESNVGEQELNADGSINTSIQCANSGKCNGCTKISWWKFWAKGSSKSCCKSSNSLNLKTDESNLNSKGDDNS